MASFDWIDAQNLKRGDIFRGQTIVHAYLVRDVSECGMWDSPEEIVWVLEDGSVWEMTHPGWLIPGAANPRRVHGPIRE